MKFDRQELITLVYNYFKSIDFSRVTPDLYWFHLVKNQSS